METVYQTREQIEQELSRLPAGYISKKHINGADRFYLQWTESGKLKSKYIKPAELEDVRRAVERRRELTAALKSMQPGNGGTADGRKETKPEGKKTMRTFQKSNKLDQVLYDVRGPVVDEAARMEEAGLKILKLNIGNPAPFGFTAPDEVITDMRDSISSSQGYSESRGIFAARKAIMQYAQI